MRWAEREHGPSQSAAPGLEANHGYEIPGAYTPRVVGVSVGVSSGSSPARSQQRPFGRRWVVVGKRQKSLGERRWVASFYYTVLEIREEEDWAAT